MKIGIYTIHCDNNYGAMLQAYATQEFLNEINIDSELINLYTIENEKKNKYLNSANNIKNIAKNFIVLTNPKIRLKSKRFADFHKRMKLSNRYYSVDEIYKNPPQYDIHLVGSDQVWNLESGIIEKNIFLLDFVPKGQYKMSYAASLGGSKTYNVDLNKLRNKLKEFTYISVREKEGVLILKERLGIESVQVMDPTFLIPSIKWEKLAGDKPLISKDYILAYGFSEKNTTNKLISYIKNKLKIDVIGISVSPFHPFNYDYFFQEAGPLEFLNLIRNAKFVITASYHGAAFAIHFRKNFFISRHKTRNSRIQSMLEQLDLDDRVIDLSNPSSYENKKIKIDYNLIENKILDSSLKSRNWFQSKIEQLNKEINEKKII